MKRLLAVALLAAALPAHAMTYFLVAQWREGVNLMCKYGNGTVLNLGATSICPMSVEG